MATSKAVSNVRHGDTRLMRTLRPLLRCAFVESACPPRRSSATSTCVVATAASIPQPALVADTAPPRAAIAQHRCAAFRLFLKEVAGNGKVPEPQLPVGYVLAGREVRGMVNRLAFWTTSRLDRCCGARSSPQKRQATTTRSMTW